MKRINSLSDLMMEELSDLLNAESQLVEALPKMADASQSSALKAALQDCLEISKEHAKRLRDIFASIMQNPQRLTCKAMKGLMTEGEDVVNNTEKSPARDAAIINVVQRVQEYEIARYKTVREHAVDLGHTKIVELFTKTLNEDRAMNFHFNELAQGVINVQAMGPQSPGQQTDQRQGPASKAKSGGFYIPERRPGMRGLRKRAKNTVVSRFISEGDLNMQGKQEKEEEKEGRNLQNPEE